ncbi:MAG: DUF3644 domain-containing protein [Armatimonadetes bacterium]|nr:DUF3644 domain-containing protein [Armatimonadota bacterium]MDE2206238.1 DUF3644 domain-containing protein [Armatimonadota bacterium]
MSRRLQRQAIGPSHYLDHLLVAVTTDSRGYRCHHNTVMPRRLGSDKIRRAYAFLVAAEGEGRIFTLAELQVESGWSNETFRANLSKKLGPYLSQFAGGYKALGVRSMTEEAFCRICSQKAALARDPTKPLLDEDVEPLVNKARDAALAAVQHYNNPTALFKSDTFIVLMVIASTALFHAIFERDGTDYTARNPNGSPRTLDDEPMLWGLRECVRHYEGGKTTQMAANVDLLLHIRHKIEHRFMPPLDDKIAGHCQSFLTNFEQLLVKEFTSYYSLNASLCLPLYLSTQRTPEAIEALRRFQTAEYGDVCKFIDDYRTALPAEIRDDQAFAFRVYLIPKTANSARSYDKAVEFIRVSECSAELLQELDRGGRPRRFLRN